MRIKFVVNAVKWFDKVNGNTYHSCEIMRTSDGVKIYCPFEYGYGEQYKHTALNKMYESGWLPKKYNTKPLNKYGGNTLAMYERENNYPIDWNVRHGLKKECIANGKGA